MLTLFTILTLYSSGAYREQTKSMIDLVFCVTVQAKKCFENVKGSRPIAFDLGRVGLKEIIFK